MNLVTIKYLLAFFNGVEGGHIDAMIKKKNKR